jgi:hypothetical protein
MIRPTSYPTLHGLPGLEIKPTDHGSVYTIGKHVAKILATTNPQPGQDRYVYSIAVGTAWEASYSHPSQEGAENAVKWWFDEVGAVDLCPNGNTHLTEQDDRRLVDMVAARSLLYTQPLTGDVLMWSGKHAPKISRIIGARDGYVTHCSDASFALLADGSASYGGGNDGFFKDVIIENVAWMPARFWIPANGRLTGGCRVDVKIIVPVWQVR